MICKFVEAKPSYWKHCLDSYDVQQPVFRKTIKKFLDMVMKKDKENGSFRDEESTMEITEAISERSMTFSERSPIKSQESDIDLKFRQILRKIGEKDQSIEAIKELSEFGKRHEDIYDWQEKLVEYCGEDSPMHRYIIQNLSSPPNRLPSGRCFIKVPGNNITAKFDKYFILKF